MRKYFEGLSEKILATRQSGEHLILSVAGENSQFVRINGSRVRQIGTVEDMSLEITLVLQGNDSNLRRASAMLTLSGLIWQDWERVQGSLATLRRQTAGLPVDPYAELPIDHGSDTNETEGQLLPIEEVPEKLLGQSAKTLDLVGIYASGPIYRGMSNSAGQRLWFSTEICTFDYSVYTKTQKALKGSYVARRWDQNNYEQELEKAREHLPVLERPTKKMAPGKYRTYLAPHAVADLVAMMSWGCVSEASIRQGDSPLQFVRQGERSFSPLFSLSEDFRQGQVPRFNEWGEIAEERLPIIENGKLKNTLVSARTAKEYGLKSNSAVLGETLRSPGVEAGELKEKEILERLGTGLYLSNLHYLNWSDQLEGRITGMTRYASFWVENGQIVSPIENMRWDESLFSLFGSDLEALTQTRCDVANVMSYERRCLGGAQVPGALLTQMTFTL